MSFLGQILIILGKDLRLEWRRRARIFAVLLFGVVALLLFSIGIGPDSEALIKAAPGFLTLALLLSSTLALAESFRAEAEDAGIEGLLLIPAEPMAIYYGKAIANAIFLLSLSPVFITCAFVLYGLQASMIEILGVFAFWLLASAGLAAPGTLYAGMTSNLRGEDILLPLLLFPLVSPVLIATVKGLDLILGGDPMGQLPSWALMLVAFDVIYWSLCGVLFPILIQEQR